MKRGVKRAGIEEEQGKKSEIGRRSEKSGHKAGRRRRWKGMRQIRRDREEEGKTRRTKTTEASGRWSARLLFHHRAMLCVPLPMSEPPLDDDLQPALNQLPFPCTVHASPRCTQVRVCEPLLLTQCLPKLRRLCSPAATFPYGRIHPLPQTFGPLPSPVFPPQEPPTLPLRPSKQCPSLFPSLSFTTIFSCGSKMGPSSREVL